MTAATDPELRRRGVTPLTAHLGKACTAGVFLVIAGSVAAWVAIDRQPPAWDHANHLERAVACAEDLSAGRVRAILERSSFYPPLVPCAAGVVYLLAPSDAAGAQAVVLLFLGIGMLATYLVGHRLFDPTAGMVAAVLFATAPFVVFSALNFQLDLPLTAMVALFLYVLLRADGLPSTAWSVAAGGVFAAGMLTKPSFAVYALPPALLVAVTLVRQRRFGRLGLGVLIAVALSLPWYGPRMFGLPFQVTSRSFTQAAESGFAEPLTAAGLLTYPRWFVPQFGALAVLLFVGGVYWAARRRPILVVACLVPFAVFLFLQNKNLRYTMPLLPAASLIAGASVASLLPLARVALCAAVLVTGALQVAATTFGIGPLAGQAPFGVELARAHPPSRAAWPHRAILKRVLDDSHGERATVSVVPNTDGFSMSNFRYYAARDGLRLRIGRAWSDYPLNIDYVILKTGNQGPEFASAKARRVTERFAADPLLAAVFPVIGEFPLPDGTRATLRVRRPQAVTGMAAGALARRMRAGAGGLLGEVVADATDLRIGLEYDDAALLRGTIRRVTISAASARVGELGRPKAATLRLRDIRVVLEGLTVNPARAALEGRIEPLALRRFRVERLTLTEADLQAFFAELTRLGRARVALLDDGARIRLAQPGPDVDLRLSVRPGSDGRPVVLDARGVRLGGVPVPDALTGWVVRNYDPTLKWAQLPVPVDVSPVRIRRGVLEVGAE